ncbi:MAG: DUF4922 domain-containing protein [Bacteroidota bacterium]
MSEQNKVEPGRCLSPEEIKPYLTGIEATGKEAVPGTLGKVDTPGTMAAQEGIPSDAEGIPADLAIQSRALLRHQREHWPMLSKGFESLETVQVRTFDFDGFGMKVQFNPGRIVSSAAKVDQKTIRERKCFLCQQNLPPEQKGVLFGDYMVLGNPFPIFSEHFTIPHLDHIPQLIRHAFEPMLDLTEAMGRYYTLFYNGPRCGASAPDHLHFQGGERGFMPLDTTWEELIARHGTWIADDDELRMARVDDGLRRYVILESDDKAKLQQQFDELYIAFSEASQQAGSEAGEDEEPMLNILSTHEDGRWRIVVFLRRKHRPARFFAEGDEKMVFSPASVDFGGVCITPVERDFHRITADDLRAMFREVSATQEVLDAVVKKL